MLTYHTFFFLLLFSSSSMFLCDYFYLFLLTYFRYIRAVYILHDVLLGSYYKLLGNVQIMYMSQNRVTI